MEHQHSPLLTWAYYCQGKSIDELRQSLLVTTVELQSLRAQAQEELTMKDDELNHLRDLLSLAVRERDEAQEKCQKLFEKLLFQQQQQQLAQLLLIQNNQTAPQSGVLGIEDEAIKQLDSNNNNFSSSETEESTVTSPQLMAPPNLDSELDLLVRNKPLTEQGKLLQAVMKAGPLLQTLLLAGPLPQWRHPPPPIDSCQIPPPPVVVPPVVFENCTRINRKRVSCEGSDMSPPEIKYQRVILH